MQQFLVVRNELQRTSAYDNVLWTFAQRSADVLPTCIIVWQQLTKSRHTQAYAKLKLPSLYSVWALRMTTFCHSLSYADARRQHVSRSLRERSQHVVIRTCTSELVVYAEKFYACTKIICVCRRTARTQQARYSHAMRTFCTSAAR